MTSVDFTARAPSSSHFLPKNALYADLPWNLGKKSNFFVPSSILGSIVFLRRHVERKPVTIGFMVITYV
jgi:hypothetical protein